MTSDQSTTSMVMDEMSMDIHGPISVDETTGENIFKTMRRVENNILILTESIQVIKREKLILDKVSNRILILNYIFWRLYSGV